MNVIQITIFIENKPGRLLSVTRFLAERGINLWSLCVADTTEYGLVRLIVDRPDEVCRLLKEKGISVRRTEIVAAELSNSPGGLNRVLELLYANDIDVEYIYSFFGGYSGICYAGFKVSDTEHCTAVLEKNGVKLLKAEDIYD